MSNKKKVISINRRKFIKSAAVAGVAIGFPTIVPSSVFGKTAPSNKITVGMIGMGRQAKYANLKPFLYSEHTKVVAVCDVDKWRLKNGKDEVDEFYKNNDCFATTDWRKIIERDDIDAIMNSTPDHWHVPISLAAVRSGKHVSCEKPLTLSVAEGRVLADAVDKAGVVFRTDSDCRTNAYMHKTAELVRNGYLGQVRRVEVGVPTGDIAGGNSAPMPIPAELDYEMWSGPALIKPYNVDRVHPHQSYKRPGWMRVRDYCEGMVTNWGTHLNDVAQLALNTERTGPIHVEGKGTYPEPGSGLWNVLLNFELQYKYENGIILDYHTDKGPFIRIEGDDGWIHASWGTGQITASDVNILRVKLKEDELHIPQREDKKDFINAIVNNEKVMVDAEVGHRACSMCQIGHIAIQTEEALGWNPTIEKFVQNDKANKLLYKSYREPWGLD